MDRKIKPLLSVSDAADALGVTPRRVRAMITAGRLPATRIGERAYAILAADLPLVRFRKPGRTPKPAR